MGVDPGSVSKKEFLRFASAAFDDASDDQLQPCMLASL
jgi:hypothetical protein